MRGIATLLIMLVCAAFMQPVQAHETTRSYAQISHYGASVTVQFRVAFRDIEVAVWIDENLDSKITWGEVQQRLEAITSYIQSGFSLNAGGACTLDFQKATISRDAGIDYLGLDFKGICPVPPPPVTASSRVFFDIDPDHRMFVSLRTGGQTTMSIVSRSNPQAAFTPKASSMAATFKNYFHEGVEHLLAGADHIVFLLVLMLPAVCGVQGNIRKAVVSVVTAITGFTIAHALTLTAVTTEVLYPPSTLINVLIALSIVVTAADNIKPFIQAPRFAVAVFFGIIHGFGFATVLDALQLGSGDLAIALAGFNLGIEAAQIAIVLVTMPALFILRGGKSLLWTGSILAGCVGVYWLWERLVLLS